MMNHQFNDKKNNVFYTLKLEKSYFQVATYKI